MLNIKEINDQKMMNLMENIKFIRSYYSFSKKKMSEIMGISVKMLNNLESGKMSKRFYAESLIKLADFLKISIDSLFEKMT